MRFNPLIYVVLLSVLFGFSVCLSFEYASVVY